MSELQIKICKQKKKTLVLYTISSYLIINTNYRVMVFNATFNNISVMSWRSVLLVEETGVPRVNH